MTARILVVDDLLPNIKLLEAKLIAEYYEVVTAMSGFEALAAAEEYNPDIILLDVMMPGMDGFETCKKLKENPETAHIPVVMVTALDQPADKVKGLSCGADDFLTKPVDDLPLFARVRSLTRLKMMSDELRARGKTGAQFGITPEDLTAKPSGDVLIIESNATVAEKMLSRLPEACRGDIETDPQKVMNLLAKNQYALIVLSLNLHGFDGLRLCSMIRSNEAYRKISVLATGEDSDNRKLIRALDLGVNDFIRRPIDYNEFYARIVTQLKGHARSEMLRKNVDSGIEAAVIDPLTGMYNRRYLNMHLNALCAKSYEYEKPLSVAMLDIDHFKSVNDTYGHDTGDVILKEVAARVKQNIRNFDLGVRTGGEEFVIVMPETDLGQAGAVAERIRQKIFEKPFYVQSLDRELTVSCSFGAAKLNTQDENPEEVIKRADLALYHAKKTGRNRVVLHKGKTASRRAA